MRIVHNLPKIPVSGTDAKHNCEHLTSVSGILIQERYLYIGDNKIRNEENKIDLKKTHI